jgi:flagellin-like hook-associated protein FlgL
VQLTDDLSIQTNTPGSEVFNDALFAAERLGRALVGFRTEPATGAPNGTGTAYTFPADLNEQTQALQGVLDTLNTARGTILTERTDLGGRLRRLETGRNLLELNKGNITKALDTLQNTDVSEAATQLTLAQNALQASLTVTSRVIGQNILDFL